MIYLVVLFIPPLYFALRNKWGAFIGNSIFYIMAVATVWFGVGVLFWFIAVIHAMWHLREELMIEHAEIMATKMAEKMAKKSGG